MKDYSDYMDDELPLPDTNLKTWFKFLGLIAAFIVGILSIALTVLYIFSNPKP